MTQRPKPVVLAILDGWGHRAEREDNAIAQAHTPVWDALLRDYPHGLINASELHVGLPAGQMGNSEVGHMNIGSGRVLMQELPKIDAAIASGALKDKLLAQLKGKPIRRVHVMGLLSDGGVHSHMHHIAAVAQLLAGQGLQVLVHAFLDGRDTPPQSALGYMEWFEGELAASPIDGASLPVIATVSGRFYAMDRDKRWERVQKAYDTLTQAGGQRFASAKEAVEASYAAGVTDEFVLPCVIGTYDGMHDGDALLALNFRADRVRELLSALVDPGFDAFARSRKVQFALALGMVEYSSALAPLVPALFPPEPLTGLLGEVVANAGLKQLRIAETEKYAHVTFFFNGGREEEFPGEERILIPSPKVATYDLKPEMSAPEVTDALVAAIESNRFDFIVVNYANTDMVGHSGNIEAAKKAVETVDTCLGRVVQATLRQGGALLITADHGNAEQMHDHDTGQSHTAHTLNLVPVVLVSQALRGAQVPIREGRLGDVAPTLLQWLGLPQPAEMTGASLLANTHG
jgi:2,3-bisphosphoglycerate-independent phosphoglycerate mutase